jgi:hypothetical protein
MIETIRIYVLGTKYPEIWQITSLNVPPPLVPTVQVGIAPAPRVTRHAIVGQALNPTVVNGMVFGWERIQQVLTIHNRTPTTRTPMGKRRPVVNLVRFCVELAGVHHPDSNAFAHVETESLE